MARSISNAQASTRRKLLLPLGTVATILFMMGLCAPLGWYAQWLHGQYGPAANLTELAPLELLIAAVLLALPFVVLRLFRVDWQAEREG